MNFDRLKSITNMRQTNPSKAAALTMPSCIKRFWAIAALSMVVGACSSAPPTPTGSPAATESPAASKDFTVGLIIVGPKNDGGWNQAH